MSNLDWSKVAPRREPTKKQVKLYRGWKKYLSNSRLDIETIERRAKHHAENNREVPKD